MLILAHLLAMASVVTLSVNPHGSDANSGLPGHPLLSLNGARLAARKYSDRTVVVEFEGGTYRQVEPVKFELRDSGPRIYRSKGNGKVILSGSQAFTPVWKPFRGAILQCQVPKGFRADQIFIGGQRQILARYPNEDLSVPILHGFASDAISSARVKGWHDPRGAYLHAMHSEMWGDFHYRIKGKDGSGNLQMEGGWQNNRRMGMHPQYRFVEGVFEELDSPGEWYLDENRGTLYFYPRIGMKLDGAIVEGVRSRGLLEVDGASGLRFEGLTFRHTARTFMDNREPLLRSDWTIYRGGAIHFKNAEECEVVDCDLTNLGGTAVFIDGMNSNIAIRRCSISHVGANGVAFVGSPSAVRNPLFEYGERQSLQAIDSTPGPKGNEFPVNCVAEDCLLSYVGEVEKQSAGVEISMSSDITVRHCSIWHTPRAGINIGDGCWGGHLIEGCDVFDTVLETGDHGSFNSWGRDRYWGLTDEDMNLGKRPDLALLDTVRPIVLRNNRWRCDHGWDIDLDDGASNYVIENNLCLHGGIKNREGFYRTVQNNIMVGNSFHPHVWFLNSGDRFLHNIVFEAYHPIGVPKPWGEDVDYNFIHQSGLRSEREASALSSLSGRDSHSVKGDALFINPLVGDYRVRIGSPTLSLGFKNFAMDSFGVRPAKLKALAKTPSLHSVVPVKEGALPTGSFLGAEIKELSDPNEMSAVGLGERRGVLVVRVIPGSPAQLVGLKPMDVVQGVGAKDVHSVEELERAARGSHSFDLHIWRAQKSSILRVRL